MEALVKLCLMRVHIGASPSQILVVCTQLQTSLAQKHNIGIFDAALAIQLQPAGTCTLVHAAAL